MAILKCVGTEQQARNAIVFDMGDLRREAERMERDANARAQAILDGAYREKQQILEAERGEGFAQGKAQGLAEGQELGRSDGREAALVETREQVAELCKQWQAALDQFETDRDGLIAAARSDILRLAISIADRVTKRRFEVDPTIVQDQLEAALEQTIACTRLKIEIAQEDQELVESVLPALSARLASGTHIDVVPQAALSRGSIVLRSAGGSVDASLQTQLDRIAEALVPGASAKAIAPVAAQKPTATDPEGRDHAE